MRPKPNRCPKCSTLARERPLHKLIFNPDQPQNYMWLCLDCIEGRKVKRTRKPVDEEKREATRKFNEHQHKKRREVLLEKQRRGEIIEVKLFDV